MTHGISEIEDHELFQARQHVRFLLGGDGGYAPGSFTTHLINAMVSADPINFAKLRTQFPKLAQAVQEYQKGELTDA